MLNPMDDPKQLEQFFARPSILLKQVFDQFKGCDTLGELLNKVLDYYPMNSDEYTALIKYLRTKFKEYYQNEYVLAVSKKSAMPYIEDMWFFDHFGYFDDYYKKTAAKEEYDKYNILYMPRHYVEWNPEFIHIVVAGLIRTVDDKYVLLKRKYGVFKDRYTMVQGHCSYGPATSPKFMTAIFEGVPNISKDRMLDLLEMDLRRELDEEVGCWDCTIDKENYMYIRPTFITPKLISYYHAGFLFNVVTKMESSKFISLEQDKNDVVIMSPDEISKLTYAQTDGWLYTFAQRQNIIQ